MIQQTTKDGHFEIFLEKETLPAGAHIIDIRTDVEAGKLWIVAFIPHKEGDIVKLKEVRDGERS